MPLATFQTSFSQSAIETEAGIIRGVNVMQLGKLAKFAAIKDDGTKLHKEVTISDAHISALLAHAGNRSIPVHLTHSAANDRVDGLSTKAGALKTFRKDESGNLVADLHLIPGEVRDLAFWHAQNDPENMMLSAVYSFLPEDALCIPQDFQAADLVEKGAGVTALLADDSQNQPTLKQPMDVNELITALQDPAVLGALKAIIKSVEDAQPEVVAEDTTPVEAEAGVIPADSYDGDTKLSATMACIARINRAHGRKLTAALADFTKAKADILVEAEAKLTATLGQSKIPAEDKSKETALFGLEKVRAGIRAQLSKQNN